MFLIIPLSTPIPNVSSTHTPLCSFHPTSLIFWIWSFLIKDYLAVFSWSTRLAWASFNSFCLPWPRNTAQVTTEFFSSRQGEESMNMYILSDQHLTDGITFCSIVVECSRMMDNLVYLSIQLEYQSTPWPACRHQMNNLGNTKKTGIYVYSLYGVLFLLPDI
jgi:hypothetical protein